MTTSTGVRIDGELNQTYGRVREDSIPTPAQITAMVDGHERYQEELRKRMEDDWALLILTPFDAGEGYREYTSNEPMTYFNRMTAALSSGKMKIRIPVARSNREKREREAGKERFILGIFKRNDERLLRLGQPTLLDSLASFVNMRGWYCGRNLLVIDPVSGEVYPDITAWDPLHVTWGMGEKGLKWVCHKTKMTHSEVREQYGLGALPEGQGGGQWDNPNTDDMGIDVYDWYDEVNNMVVINGVFAKPPTPHSPIRRVPAFFGAVGPVPLVQSQNFTGNRNLIHQGESIFAANRRIYEKLNLVLSTMLQLVALSRDHAFYITSADGQKQLKGNPSLEGTQFGLAFGETFNLVPLLEMSKDTGTFLGLVQGEVQRGALPYSVYGQLAFQLSGYAVNLLKQATDTPVLPRKQAIENAYWQITNAISDQFATGAYGAMKLRGWEQNRNWFDEEFTPEMIVGLPSAEIELKVNTPQDDLQKIQMARMATEGPWPMVSMRHAWDEILDIQDTDNMADEIKEEMAEKMIPTAVLMVLMQAAEREGRNELAMLYYGELLKIGIMGLQSPKGLIPTNGKGEGGGGFSPEVAPGPMQGAPTPQPTPQQGANVPPESARPGASYSAGQE